MNVPNAERFRETLEAELRKHSSRAVDLLIVPDIAAWATQRCSNAKGNPIAMAIVDQESKGWGILVQSSIGSQHIESVIDRIEYAGHFNAAEILSTEVLFLRHLVLHELAHLENNWDQSHEDDCDEWAFLRLLHSEASQVTPRK